MRDFERNDTRRYWRDGVVGLVVGRPGRESVRGAHCGARGPRSLALRQRLSFQTLNGAHVSACLFLEPARLPARCNEIEGDP